MQKQQLNTWYAELVNIYATSSDATAEKSTIEEQRQEAQQMVR